MVQPARASFVLVLLAVLACTAARHAYAGGDSSAAASASPVTDADLTKAISQLGDSDFRVRERATHVLWSAGEAAEPALRRALDARPADPEVARRIRSILSNIAYGITPDMPADVVALMTRYRTGGKPERRTAAEELVGRGAAGARVLLKLRAEGHGDKDDHETRDHIRSLLARSARELALELIAEADTHTAGELLAVATERADDEQPALDYAAFLFVHGGLDEAIKRTQAKLDGFARQGFVTNQLVRDQPPAYVLMVCLHRANGDLAAAKNVAKVAAEERGDDTLLRNILIEAGDWNELARRSAATAANDDAELEQLAFAAAFHRLAGDEAGLDKFTARVAAAADRDPGRAWQAAESLFLNGRVAQGHDLLVRHNQLDTAADFYAARLDFEQVVRLLERAQASGMTKHVGYLEVKAARAAWFTGTPVANAAAALEAAVKTCEKHRDFDGLAAAVGAASEMGLAERARWFTVAALQVWHAAQQPGAAHAVQPNDGDPDPAAPLVTLFERAKLRNPDRAVKWWALLRERFPKEPVGMTFGRLRSLDDGTLKGEELAALCEQIVLTVRRHAPIKREERFELLADALADAGRTAQAAALYGDVVALAGQRNPTRAAGALSRLAAMDAAAGKWRAAADRYWDAWSRDRANPVPLYQSGDALVRAGDTRAGQQRMQLARLVPLGDDERRFALQELLLERKLTDDTRRERDVILRTSRFMSWRRSDVLRRAGDDAHAAGDHAKAADLWERAFLDNHSAATRFLDRWANVSMPALVRRTRAVAMIRAGKLSAGLTEANAALSACPDDADGLIELVTTLDAAGHSPEADVLYRDVAQRRYAKLCATYPQSGPLHNLYAWAAAKCRRELDLALSHARRAVELQPASTACIDTLAEAHFQRREFAEAIGAMERCVQLEPGEPRHKEQLERFRKAQAAAGAPPTTTKKK